VIVPLGKQQQQQKKKQLETGGGFGGGGGRGGGGSAVALTPILILAAVIGSIVFFTTTSSQPSPPSSPPLPTPPPSLPSPTTPPTTPPLPPPLPQTPPPLSPPSTPCDAEEEITSIQYSHSGTQHVFVDVEAQEINIVNTGNFSTDIHREMQDSDLIFMSGASNFLLRTSLLLTGVTLDQTVDHVCLTPPVMAPWTEVTDGRCGIPQSFYDKFNVGNLAIINLFNHATKLPDFMDADDESTTVMTEYAADPLVPLSGNLNAVRHKIIVEGAPVLDAEKFQMLVDFYNETNSSEYSSTNNLVVQYLLEYSAVKSTAAFLREDLGVECSPTYDSKNGSEVVFIDDPDGDGVDNGLAQDVSSTYRTMDNGGLYVDVLKDHKKLYVDGSASFSQGAIYKNILKTVGPAGNIICRASSVAEMLLGVAMGDIDVQFAEWHRLDSNFEVTTIDGVRYKSMGGSGSGGVQARILVTEGTGVAKYIVVGSFNTAVEYPNGRYPAGVFELLQRCFRP